MIEMRGEICPDVQNLVWKEYVEKILWDFHHRESMWPGKPHVQQILFLVTLGNMIRLHFSAPLQLEKAL